MRSPRPASASRNAKSPAGGKKGTGTKLRKGGEIRASPLFAVYLLKAILDADPQEARRFDCDRQALVERRAACVDLPNPVV